MKVRSSRRVIGLKPSDYDHEISLVNHDGPAPIPRQGNLEPQLSQTGTSSELLTTGGNQSNTSRQDVSSDDDDDNNGGRSRVEPEPTSDTTTTTKTHIVDGANLEQDTAPGFEPNIPPIIGIQAPTPAPQPPPNQYPESRRSRDRRETAIDILYENERGGFLCGMPLFSYKALGGLDAPPWTNAYHKPSLTNINTAQLPDPSWEWVWPEWRVNHQDGMDEMGWEYSFAFAKMFSWHGPKWWNSFVRRRAWTRRRVKKKAEDLGSDPHMLNTDYFTVRPASQRTRRSISTLGSRVPSNTDMSQLSNADTVEEKQDITDLVTLMQTLRLARIDREKREAIENYLEHATDLEGLQSEMHEIMSLFVFQASRRLLLGHLMQKHNETVQLLEKDHSVDLKEQKIALDAAVRHADEEVRRLAYWSDVKQMVANGESRPSLDEDASCFYETYPGVDHSGPLPPNNGKLPGDGSP